MKTTIQNLRQSIDSIDDQIIDLLSKRQKKIEAIGAVKKEEKLPVYDAKRELETRTRRRARAKNQGLDPFRTEVIFEQIVSLSRDTQQTIHTANLSALPKVLVGVMGGIASFSEEAAFRYFQNHSIKNFELHYPITAENVLKELSQKKIDLSVFPIENSTAGLVLESIHAMSRFPIDIQEIFEIEINHCLHVLPGVKKNEITKITSHPQAIGQCKGYLKKYFPHAELIEATDTAEGARILEQNPEERHLAVIASKRAGELYHLETLEVGIQDLKVNFTRFIAATRPF